MEEYKSFKDFMSEGFKEKHQLESDARYIAPDIERSLHEFEVGKEIGSPSWISALDLTFSWKRGFQYCLTGHPNSGKTTFMFFLMILKSMRDGWKWLIWSPEMLDSFRQDGKVKISASDIYDELAFMYLGENVYRHYYQKYNFPMVSRELYQEALYWVKQHFFVIQPEDNKYQSLVDNYLYFYEKLGTDGICADPFKNLIMPDGDRYDNILHRVFADIKLITLDTNACWNWVAHPKADKNFRNTDGSYRIATQFDLAGGAAWNNSMDVITTYYRPWVHKDYQDPLGEFHTLKVRKQQLLGRPGAYKHIEFQFKTNRFYFDGECPIDGSTIVPKYPSEDYRDPAEKTDFWNN